MKHRKFILLGACGLLLAGALLMFVSLAAARFQPERFSKNGPWEERHYTLPAEGITELYLDTQEFAVEVLPYEGSDIDIRYYVNEALGYEESVAGGRMSLTKQPKEPNRWLRWLDMNFDAHTYVVQLRIPQGHALAVELVNANGSIHVASLDFTRLNLKTSNDTISLKDVASRGEIFLKSSNGALHLENVSAEGDLTCKTSNNAIDLAGVDSPRLSVKTSNGSLRFEALAFGQAELITSNSSIHGTLEGSEAEFSITAKTSNGRITLGDSLLKEGGQGSVGSGAKKLDLQTSNGSIHVAFHAMAQQSNAAVPQEPWQAAYAEYFSNLADEELQSAYVTDIDGNGIPEVFVDFWFRRAPQYFVFYNESTGAAETLYFNVGGSSGWHGAYFAEGYLMYCWQAGTTGAVYASVAETFAMGENGFEVADTLTLTEEEIVHLDGEDDEAHVQRVSAEFQAKLDAWTEGIALTDYADVCVQNDITAYLADALSIVIQ